MNVPLIIGVVLLGGLSLGWVLHRRSVGHVLPILKRVAVETDGEINWQGPFVMPKLVFTHSGTEVEVSSASTATEGESIRYTYALFKGLTWKDFEFRIVPRSLQTVADQWVGLKKPMGTEVGKLKDRLVIYTNDNRRMVAILSERIQEDLQFWAHGKKENRISDIRNYDDKLLYAVTGTLDNYEELKLLIRSACNFFDSVNNMISNPSASNNA